MRFGLSLIACFLATYIEAKGFEVSIGNQNARQFKEGEVIELRGTGKQVKSEFMQGSAVDEKSLLENAFMEGGDTIILKGAPQNKNQTKPQINKPQPEKTTYGDLTKEIPIPTDFNILNQALDSHTAMPTSSAPKGLPDFFGFKEVVSDKDLRSLIRNLSRASKRKVDWNNVDLDVLKEEAKPTQSAEVELALTKIEREWYEPLKKETQLMMLSGLPMKVVLVPSRDDLMYQFMLSDVAKGSEANLSYKKFDDGIFSVLGMPLINGKKVPMCYLVFDNMIEDYANKILNPLKAKVGVEATASLVVGHNVGICLDELERQKKVSKKNTWFANEVHQIGVYSNHFQTLFPRGMKATIFNLKEREIMSANSQRQYQQRVADSFAVLWAYNRGYKKAYDAFISVKDYVNPTSTHYTVPALKRLNQKLIAMRTNVLTLSNIWKIARENQKKIGVEKEIKATYEANYLPQESELKQNKSYVNGRGLNTMSNVRNMNTLKNMNQLPTSRSTGKPVANMRDVKTFESTKNNQLSSMNFNVRDLIRQEPNRHEVVKHVNAKNDVKTTERKLKNMNEVKRFGVEKNNQVVQVDKAKDRVLTGTRNQPQKAVEEKKEVKPIRARDNKPTETLKVKDEIRENLLNGTLELETKGQLSF